MIRSDGSINPRKFPQKRSPEILLSQISNFTHLTHTTSGNLFIGQRKDIRKTTWLKYFNQNCQSWTEFCRNLPDIEE